MIRLINYLKLGFLTIIFILSFIKFNYLPFAIVLFALFSLLSLNYKTKNLYDYKGALFIIIFFIINVISLKYSQNFKDGFTTIQTQLSLILFPALVYFDFKFYKKNVLTIKTIYIIASFSSIAILTFIFIKNGNLSKVIESSQKLDLFDLIRSFKLSAEQHPSYISMGYLFSAILIWRSLKNSKNHFSFLFKILVISIILVFIFFLNSRAVLVSVLMVIIFYTLKYFIEHKWIYKIIVISFLIIGFIFFIKNTRFKEVFQKFENATTIEQIDIRLSLWHDALIVWKEKPIFGHGIGDGKDAIILVHEQRKIKEAIKYKFNAHNQFLETAMQTGIVGLIILILVFAVPLYQSIKKKQELLFLFLMICLINFMFESMLQRLTGVVFFSFWYSFLWFVYYGKEPRIDINK